MTYAGVNPMKGTPHDGGDTLSKLYYVQDTRTYVGNCMLWWAKNNKGYTCHLAKAHVYTQQEVDRFQRDTDVAWPKDLVDETASMMVDHQLMPHLPPEDAQRFMDSDSPKLTQEDRDAIQRGLRAARRDLAIARGLLPQTDEDESEEV